MDKLFKNADEYVAAHEKFFESHPDVPMAEDVECLNLVMRKEYAEQILAGTKKLEFREYKDFYVKRLIDSNVSDYMRSHIDDDDVVMFCNDIRQVKMIHFYNYNRSWYLDVEVTFNDAFCINDHDIEFLQKEYGCHDFDEDLRRMNAMKVPDEERPWLFYFVIGKILGTDLEVKPKDEEYVEICGGIKYDMTDKFKKWTKEAEENKDIITFKVRTTEFKGFSNYEMCEFTREITPKNIGQFFILDEKGAIKEINGIPQFKRYDAIQLTCKDDSCTRLINDADITFWDEEYGNTIYYLKLSEEEREDFDYTDGMITYTLGEKIN